MSSTVAATLSSIAAGIAAEATKPTVPTNVRRIVLTGFMGVGKSTVGALLAVRLGWTFVDLDNVLEERTGLTVPQLFARDGERGFRRTESIALASALRGTETVLALGGGTPESLTNRLLLEQTPGTIVLFLQAPFPTLFDRCVLQPVERPILSDPAAAQVRFVERQPLYRRLARHTIDTSERTPEDVMDEILAAIAPR